ncbi:hypothetical protein NEILACOT_04398 [Neisseria lactamica ATCC 23970]|uniref:Uncharacterized protein n=1 Tax=Neisseria lactamica ATCC 23970 TaxID=546265 RepID=D0WA30_NEILA|nr:hypothetical protein NEILACOT_04398 [Neisseria lactamica ATCC 23970]
MFYRHYRICFNAMRLIETRTSRRCPNRTTPRQPSKIWLMPGLGLIKY